MLERWLHSHASDESPGIQRRFVRSAADQAIGQAWAGRGASRISLETRNAGAGIPALRKTVRNCSTGADKGALTNGNLPQHSQFTQDHTLQSTHRTLPKMPSTDRAPLCIFARECDSLFPSPAHRGCRRRVSLRSSLTNSGSHSSASVCVCLLTAAPGRRGLLRCEDSKKEGRVPRGRVAARGFRELTGL